MRTLVGLVQACHRLSVNTAERFGDLSEQSLKDALECFGQEPRSAADKLYYLKLSLDQESTGGGSSTSPDSSLPVFMTMDLQSLSENFGDAGVNAKNVAGGMGIFVEQLLAFVRDHLVSRPLVMAVAAAAERSADGKGEDEGIQEGFLLLCEVRLLSLVTRRD